MPGKNKCARALLLCSYSYRLFPQKPFRTRRSSGGGGMRGANINNREHTHTPHSLQAKVSPTINKYSQRGVKLFAFPTENVIDKCLIALSRAPPRCTLYTYIRVCPLYAPGMTVFVSKGLLPTRRRVLLWTPHHNLRGWIAAQFPRKARVHGTLFGFA